MIRKRIVPVLLTVLIFGAVSCDDSHEELENSTVPEEHLDGKEIYLNNYCHSCHGIYGGGDGPAAVKRLKPRDFSDRSAYKYGADADSIAKTIASGIDGGKTGMQGYPHIRPEDRMKIAEYIVYLQNREK